MSNFRHYTNRLIEKVHAGWLQSAFKRGLIQSLTVMLITTCVWMSGRTLVSLQTSRHSIQPHHDRRLLSDTDTSSEDSSMDGYERYQRMQAEYGYQHYSREHDDGSRIIESRSHAGSGGEESHFLSSPASTVPQGRLPSEEADSSEDRSWLQVYESADSRHEPEDWELLILDRIRQTADSTDDSDDEVDSPELYRIDTPVSVNWGSDRDNEVSNFPVSPTNTLPQESSMDDLEMDRKFARNLRVRRDKQDAKDRKETAEKHVMEFMQKKRQRERKFPNVKSFNYWKELLHLRLAEAGPRYEIGKQQHNQFHDLEIMENRHIRDLDKIEKGESEAFAKESKPDPQRVASNVITPQAKPSLIPQARKRNPADRQREILVRTKARQKMLSQMAANVRLPVDIPEMADMYPLDVTLEMDPVGIPETHPVKVPEMAPYARQMFL